MADENAFMMSIFQNKLTTVYTTIASGSNIGNNFIAAQG